MQKDFQSLNISKEILKAIGEMGFVNPTKVQSLAIPQILDGNDVIVMSKTGSGKTAVFGIPLLDLISPDNKGPKALILTPTRELAVQVENDFSLMSKYLSHKITAVYGQHNIKTEINDLKKGVDIVTGTPGRVYDHLENNTLKTENIRYLVLDEADRMLDMGFLPQVIRIIKSLPKDRLTLLFSATVPYEVREISHKFMNNPEIIEIESPTMTVDTIKQIYYRSSRKEKNGKLLDILEYEQPENCMIFCNTKISTDRVSSFLNRKGIKAYPLHGDIPQNKRMKTIEGFKNKDFRILVATDVAARGLHIESLSLVINYDVPQEKDSYVHRIGRTGRAGKDGYAISFVTEEEIMSLYEIEEHIGSMIEEAEFPSLSEIRKRKNSPGKNIRESKMPQSPEKATHKKHNSKSRGRSFKKPDSSPGPGSKFKMRTTTAPGKEIPSLKHAGENKAVSDEKKGKKSLLKKIINKVKGK